MHICVCIYVHTWIYTDMYMYTFVHYLPKALSRCGRKLLLKEKNSFSFA